MHWRRTLLIAVVGVLGGCALTPFQSGPSTSVAPFSLTTISTRACHHVDLAGYSLRTDPADSHAAWLENDKGQRIEVVWPSGYRAEWNLLGDVPWLAVYDAKGRLFMTTTDIPAARHVCDSGQPGTVLLMQTDP